MLRIDFTDLREKYPDLVTVANELETWLNSHQNLSHISSSRVLAERPRIQPWELVEALRILVEEGQLRRVYGVLDPHSGTLISQFFDTPESIPDRLYNRFADPFEADDAEIVPLYKERIQ